MADDWSPLLAAASQLAWSDEVGKGPTMTPGATSAPINVRAMLMQNPHPGDARGRAQSPAQHPSHYNELAGEPPPNVVADVDLDQNWFSPFQPVNPFGTPYVNYPRTFDYTVGTNIDYVPARVSFFEMLRAMAQSWGVLRAVIETRKDQLLRLPFDFRVKDKPKSKDKRLDELREFFRRPDRKDKFGKWTRKLLEDLFVIDAPALYVWRTAGGKPYAIDVLDGATIKPLIDDAGRRPDYPSPAYQQIIKGLPLINLDETELLYAPMRPRTSMPIYGYSPVEQIFIEVTEGIRKQLYRAAYWNEGTIPDMFITVPETWQPQQIAAYQAMFDAMMSGNLAFKSKVRFIPGGMQPFEMKNADGQGASSTRDEELVRLVCFAFSVSPQPFVKMMNRATSETASEDAEEEGLHPLMAWFKDEIMDPLVQEPIGFGYGDIEFCWLPEAEVNEQVQMEVETGYVKAGVKTIDEAREKLNLAPLPDGAGAEAIVETATGPVPLKETVEANRQRAIAVPDELDRQQESHDQNMANASSGADADKDKPAKAEPAAAKKKEVGKHADAPFGKGRDLKRLPPILASRPVVQRIVRIATRRIAGQLSDVGAAVAGQVRKLDKVVKDASDPKKQAAEITDAIDLGLLSEIGDDLADDLQSVYEDAAAEALISVGLEDNEDIVNLVNERAVGAAREQAADLVTNIDGSTRDMLRDLIANGLEDNLGLDEIAAQIEEATAFDEDRADLIARTEIASANSDGALDGYRTARDEADVDVRKEWLLGPNPCEICQANADEGPIDLDDDWSSGDDAPPAHPNCECAISPVVGE